MGFVVNYPPVTTVTVDESTNEVVVAAAGPRGPQGEQGDAATVAVGTTSTGAAGSDAAVSNSGTTSAAVFDFTIPRGDTGAQGIQGEQGPQGDPGTAASVTVGTTTTGAEGSDADVTNSGTSSAAVLDFTIPRGDTGATGAQGPQGDPGVVAATAPITYDSGTQTVGINEAGIEIAPSQVTGTAVVDNDSRLSDARTPTAHATSHEDGGSDELSLNLTQISRTVDTKTASFTLTSSDAGKVIAVNSTADVDVTVNGSLDLAVGDVIEFVALGTGAVRFVESGATVNANGDKIMGPQFSKASLLCTAADTYLLSGDLNTGMVFVFDTSLGDTTVEMPLEGTVDARIDWGDGSADLYTTTGTKSHTYASGGTYTVRVSGTLTEFGANVSRPELTKCLSFGEVGITSLASAFRNCANLTVVPTALPSTSSVVTMVSMFHFATSFNQDIGSWDTSSVTDMNFTFTRAEQFNQDIGGWDTSSVTYMNFTFEDAYSFNNGGSSSINNWDVSNVTSMKQIFDTSGFNQDIGDWNTENVTNMAAAFRDTPFNQDISTWDISNVTDMTSMFVNVTLSTTNYDALLIGWSAQTVQSGVTFHGGNSQYSAGAATTARGVLTGAPNNWTITDGGQA